MKMWSYRFARPSDDFDSVLRFYQEGLGFKILGQFQDHEGFDGLMLGKSSQPFHLEFTRHREAQAPRSPSADLLLVIYLDSKTEFDEIVSRMKSLGIDPVRSLNPYWDRNGVTFEDHDGYRVVLVQGKPPL